MGTAAFLATDGQPACASCRTPAASAHSKSARYRGPRRQTTPRARPAAWAARHDRRFHSHPSPPAQSNKSIHKCPRENAFTHSSSWLENVQQIPVISRSFSDVREINTCIPGMKRVPPPVQARRSRRQTQARPRRNGCARPLDASSTYVDRINRYQSPCKTMRAIETSVTTSWMSPDCVRVPDCAIQRHSYYWPK